MMFIELLFWKNAATSEEVGRRYDWLVGSYMGGSGRRCRVCCFATCYILLAAWVSIFSICSIAG